MELLKLGFTSQESEGKSGPTHQRVSWAGLEQGGLPPSPGGHGLWPMGRAAERENGRSKSWALTVKSGSGGRNLRSLGSWLPPPGEPGRWQLPQKGARRVRPGFQPGTEGSQSPGAPAEWEKRPRAPGTRKLESRSLTSGAMARPMAVGTEQLHGPHPVRPVTPQLTQEATGTQGRGLPPDPAG